MLTGLTRRWSGTAEAKTRPIVRTVAARYWPVAVAVVAATWMYGPALNSAFLGDDYLLLLASRQMPLGEFLRATWDPSADAGILQLSENYWRPLSFLTFRGMYWIFGGDPLPYHLFNLGVHLASVVLVFELTRRLVDGRLAPAVAAFVMALHPAGRESITWIASLNSAGLPLALAAWLAFLPATDAARSRSSRLTWCGASVVLTMAALLFRETAAAVTVAMVLWYVLVPGRGRWAERNTWLLAALPLVPVALAAALSFFGVSSGSRDALVGAEANALDRWWFYVKLALVPQAADPGEGAFVLWPQRALAFVMIAVPIGALLRRDWLLAALGLGFLVSLVPYALFGLGFGIRYFYYPSALLALVAGTVAQRLWDGRSLPSPLRAPAAAALLVVVAVAALVGCDAVTDWRRENPDVHQHWVDGLRREHPTLPAGGAVWAIDTPYPLSLLDAYILSPTVAYYYGDPGRAVYSTGSGNLWYVEAIVGPDDRIYRFQPKD
ncbi:MAG: glycosyltransferase family 39 protein [Dehalococcoidia bacterium]